MEIDSENKCCIEAKSFDNNNFWGMLIKNADLGEIYKIYSPGMVACVYHVILIGSLNDIREGYN